MQAFFTLLRRAGTVSNTGARYGPGSAARRFAKSYALHCVRGTHCTNLGVLLVLTGIGFFNRQHVGHPHLAAKDVYRAAEFWLKARNNRAAEDETSHQPCFTIAIGGLLWTSSSIFSSSCRRGSRRFSHGPGRW
jgi:hypothetical protein